MAPGSDLERLHSAWRALSGNREEAGWQTIPVGPFGSCLLRAGRHFPGDEEAVLIGFKAAQVPSDSRLPQGQGFRVERVRHEVDGLARVWVSLSRRPGGNPDMFFRMAEDVLALISTHRNVGDQSLLNLSLARIQAWQEFMRSGRSEVLGPEAEVGLVGELLILKQLMEMGLPSVSVLDGWRGPLDGLHDFLIGSGAIEVKSTLAERGFPANVRSLEQLDAALVSPLFLAGVRLALDAAGASLPETVAAIAKAMDGTIEEKATFDILLLKAGFLPVLADTYSRRFSHVETRLWAVDAQFPGLTRGNVNPSIRRVWYELDLDLVGAPVAGLARALRELRVSI